MAQPHAIPIYGFDNHFPVRVRPASRLNDDELFELCQRNSELRIERTSEGEIIVTSPTGGETGRRNFLLTAALAGWTAHDGIGFDSSTGFILPNGAERAPDAAWLRRDRWEALTLEQRRKFVPLCPDFVVELRSPSDSLAETQAKMDEYIACGARLGWLIDVDAKRAWIYRQGRAVETVEGATTLAGEPEMAGLVIDLAALE
ncbi:MAG TPA: Uma2 family endonuclease [Polyangiaceae bacterium]